MIWLSVIWLSRELLDHKQKTKEKYLSNYSALATWTVLRHAQKFDRGNFLRTSVVCCRTSVRVKLQYVNLNDQIYEVAPTLKLFDVTITAIKCCFCYRDNGYRDNSYHDNRIKMTTELQ